MSNNPQNQNSLEEELKAAFESDNSDKNYNMVKGIVNSLPGGSLLGGFFESYCKSPAEERSFKFFEILVQEIKKLESKIELVDFKSPAFQTTIASLFES